MTSLIMQRIWKTGLIASFGVGKTIKINLRKGWINWIIVEESWSLEVSIVKKVRRARKRIIQTPGTPKLHNYPKQTTTLKAHLGESKAFETLQAIWEKI